MVVSPFNWIDKVIEKVGEKVGRMLNEEALRGQSMREVEKKPQLKD